MSNQNRHHSAHSLGVNSVARDHHNSCYSSQQSTSQSDRQDINCSPLRHGQGSTSRPQVSPLPVSQQPQPVSRSDGIRQKSAIVSNIGLESSGVGNTVFPNFDFGLNVDVSSQSANNNSPLSARGSGHRRNQSSVDMSGIELPFEITGDEYDLPHSPRTYAYLEAIANRIHNTTRNSQWTPVSLNSKSVHSTQHSDSQRRQTSSGAHSVKDIPAFQYVGDNTHETQHAAIDTVKAQSTSCHSSNLLPRFDERYTLPLTGARLDPHHPQSTTDVKATFSGPVTSNDPFMVINGRSVLKEQDSSPGIGPPIRVLTASEVREREHVLKDLQDQLTAARAEIEELKTTDRKREPPLALQQSSHSTYHKHGTFAAQNFQVSQSIGDFAVKNPISMPSHAIASNPHQVQAPLTDTLPTADLSWDYSRNIEDVRILAEHWAEMHMRFYEQETRVYPEVLRTLLINACGPELVRPLLESKKTRGFVVVRLLFGYLVDCLANTDIFMGFDTDTDRQVTNANNTLNTPFSSVAVRKAALMDLAAVSAYIRGSPRWHEFLQMLFMKHTFELWSIMEPLLPRDVNRSKANADLSAFVRESVKLAGRMVGDAPGYEWTMVFHRAGVLFKCAEMVDRSAMIAGDPTSPQNRNLRVKLSVTPTIVRREYIGMSIVADTMHRANVLLMG